MGWPTSGRRARARASPKSCKLIYIELSIARHPPRVRIEGRCGDAEVVRDPRSRATQAATVAKLRGGGPMRSDTVGA